MLLSEASESRLQHEHSTINTTLSPPSQSAGRRTKPGKFPVLYTLSMPGLHEFIFKNWVSAETEGLTLQSDPAFSSYVSFHFCLHYFPLVLLCITHPYPSAIQFGFKWCEMFSSLTAMCYQLSVQSCSRHSPWRIQTLRRNGISLMSLQREEERVKASFEATPFNQDASFPSVLFAASSQGHEAVLKPWVFSF